jgi:alpha-L-rhamnosidase
MIKAIDLRTEYLKAPIGIDFRFPRLSWIAVDGEKQTAYRVTAVNAKNEMCFDSGKVLTNETYCIFTGNLKSRDRITWSVTLWDEQDKIGEATNATFELGLNKENWLAKWINPEISVDTEKRQPASYLRKKFFIDKTSNGRLYVTAHGIYNVYLNGKEVEGFLYAPGTSQYDKRLQVQTYDVSDLLLEGENYIVVTLGDGWYRGCVHNDSITNDFGSDVALLCQLEVGGRPVLLSDESWQASQSGPLGINDLKMGEVYDATKEEICDWHSVVVENFGYNNLLGVDSVPVTSHERFKANLKKTPSGEIVLDFGQNFAGFVEFQINAKEGDKIVLTHGETLDENGNFTIQNFQNPRNPVCYQKIEYICKNGLNKYHATKCFFGFRYVKVETSLDITGEEFTGVAVYSDMKQTAFFECGNKDVNQLFKNVVWSMKGNFLEVPTDCPTREKSGYSGDLQIFAHTAMYLMDCYPVLRKWIAEQGATQFDDGCVRQVAPDNRPRYIFDGGAGWCDSFELVPYRLMSRYNDTTVAKENYEKIKKWMNFCLERAKTTRDENMDIPEELRNYFVDGGMHWGEWLEPGSNAVNDLVETGKHGNPEVATAYLAYGCSCMAEIAQRLGKSEDAAFFNDAAKKARDAYRYRFIKNNSVTSSRQCCYVRPIAFSLLSEEEKYLVAAELAENIRQNNGTLNTGFLTTNDLCCVLSDYGQSETAYELLLQEEVPGWLYQVKKGATTILENWNGIAEDGTVKDSHNHYSFGSIAGWLIDRVCGIIVEDGKVTICPIPNRALGYAKAEYLSPLGKIESGWKYTDDEILFNIVIPCNVMATVLLPDGSKYEMKPGKYQYKFKI